jgi:DNA-binding response OmpR family regulator
MTPEEKKTIRPRLLAVDDDIGMRAMLDTALSPHYDVVCLPHGGEILKMIESHAPEVLLLDVNIAGDDGFEICERVRARFRLLPIIFMTARTDNATFVRTLGEAGSAQIQKPFEVPALRKKIEEMLRKGPTSGP